MEMLEYAHLIGAAKFIGIGTVAEYLFCESIMDVNAKQTPNDMYGAAKTAVHYLLETCARLLKMHFIWTVIPSTFGEGRRDNNIITYTILSLLRGENRVRILDTDVGLFVCQRGSKSIPLYWRKGIAGKTYAIGSGVFKPLKDYITMIREIINPELELGIGAKPELSDKAFRSCVSIYDLTKDTGFVLEIFF